MCHNGNLVHFPHSPLLIKLFIYFDFAFVHELFASGQMGAVMSRTMDNAATGSGGPVIQY